MMTVASENGQAHRLLHSGVDGPACVSSFFASIGLEITGAAGKVSFSSRHMWEHTHWAEA